MRVAVLGCGSIGRRHLNNLLHLGYTDLLAFDPSPDARQYIEQELGIAVAALLDEIWEREPNVVLICAPPNLHVDLALAAARQGCHLFIEKPLSHSRQGLDGLAAEIGRRRLVNMVACNMRFHPGPATIKQLLEQGAIGEVIAARLQFSSYLPRWRPWQDYRQSYTASPEWGGAILDCIHEIDLALWYFGLARVVASACLPATAIGLKTDGLAEIILRHDSGVLTNVHLNFVQRDYYRTCQIIGREGTVHWNFGEGQITVYGPDGALTASHPEPEKWDLNQMYIDELGHFLQAVQQSKKTINPVAGGLATLEVALAARQGGKVR